MNLVVQQLVNGPLKAKLNKDDLENLLQAKIQVFAGGGGFSDLRGDFQQPLLLLMVIVALVLVIACVNVANLLLARASARQKEIAVRVAIGAAPSRIVRQLVTESIFLAFAGGALGLLMARWGTAALLKLSKTTEIQASPDLRVFLFTAAVCFVTGILFGLMPALRLRSVAVALTLKSGSQNGSNAPAGWNWGKSLVTAQVAFPCWSCLSPGFWSEACKIFATWTWAITGSICCWFPPIHWPLVMTNSALPSLAMS